MTKKYEHSFGVIPLKKREDTWNVLLVQLYAGHWGFPKGHPDPNETPLETASRELFEETGLQISRLLTEQTLEEVYFFKFKDDLIHKKVTYYIAEVNGSLKRMAEEIKALKWVSLTTAADYVTFDQAKEISRKAAKIVME